MCLLYGLDWTSRTGHFARDLVPKVYFMGQQEIACNGFHRLVGHATVHRSIERSYVPNDKITDQETLIEQSVML